MDIAKKVTKEKKVTGLSFEIEVLERVDKLCAELGYYRSEMVNILLKDALDKINKK